MGLSVSSIACDVADDVQVEAMLYLTSRRSGFVVGETLRVGGGFALQV